MKHRRPGNNASRRYHDRVARKYDAIYGDEYWEFHDRLTWEAIKPFLPKDASARCCDLGCGTGKWGLKILKSGFATTFVDQSAAMIEQTRAKVAEMARKSEKATLLTADIVDLAELAEGQFELVVAMGDVLSICSDASRAVREMRRICASGGVIIATADNKLAGLDYFLQRGDVGGLGSFVRTGRTHWLTKDSSEQFELRMFTPGELRKLFESNGLQVIKLTGKPILPVRNFKEILSDGAAFDQLMRVEMELAGDESAAARASHLQVVARKV
jgi:ubiquinone/menaquinone biosynthesis C-methylase UbiE